MTSTKTIVIRSSSGTPKSEATLVAWRSCGLRGTHNHDGRYSRSIGIDAAGNAYETTSHGWRRATSNAVGIRSAFCTEGGAA